MAYLARIEPHTAQPVAFQPKLVPASTLVAPAPEFSALEWSVIRLARVDGLSTLREPGRLGRFLNWLMGRNGSPELANERLEALRRISVLSWHYGFTVPSEDVADFLAAGFTSEQYELLVTSVRAAISSGSQRIH
jgi:alkylhydroperoxidase family enzyme